jgi:hypothetical protein
MSSSGGPVPITSGNTRRHGNSFVQNLLPVLDPESDFTFFDSTQFGEGLKKLMVPELFEK